MTAAARLEQEEQELETYLRRVGFPPLPSGELSGGGAGLRHRPAPTVDTLRALHQCQGRNVPFENIDQHCGRRIVLDVDVIYHKVVQRRRGGFCFELNGLYAEMLRRIGFDVVLYPARVQSEGNWTALKSHVVTVARVKGEDGEVQTWISDAGYASCPHLPLRYDRLREEQPGDGEWTGFRLTRVKSQVEEDDPDEECVMMERRSRSDGQWHKAILIYEQPSSLAELTPNCDALQADEQTHLSKRILVSAISESGRKTMSGAYKLITTSFGADDRRVERNIMLGDDGQRVARESPNAKSEAAEEQEQEERLPTEKEVYLAVLQREFGLQLTEDEQRALDLEKSKRNASVW